MSYRIDGQDVVIEGFEKGIADSPYKGIADMRNVEIISIPGEGSVAYQEIAAAAPPVMNAVAYTAQAVGDTITVASTAGLYAGCAIVLASNTATGLTNGIVYYVGTITSTTFQVFLTPALITPVDITVNGSGTLTTYQYGNQRGKASHAPLAYYVDRSGAGSLDYCVYLIDGSGYVWMILTATIGNTPAGSLIFAGNIGGLGAAATISGAGIAVWKGYLMVFGAQATGIDYAALGSLQVSDGPAIAWHYAWKTPATASFNQRISVITSQFDDNLYFTSDAGLGSIQEVDGETFAPATSATYVYTDTALTIPTNDQATCIASLGTTLLVGGILSYVYPWDTISTTYNAPLVIPDYVIYNIVGTNSNAYIFAGNRGRIYITNGYSIDMFKKLPDYITGTINPYYTWRDASYFRNQLYFSFASSTNAGVALTNTGGAWAIDMDSEAFRMINKTTVSGYAPDIWMVAELPAYRLFTQPTGSSMIMGWTNSGTYGVDIPGTVPYSSLESYIDTDMIPIGTFLNTFTPTNIEWKTSYPIGANGTSETIKISYRKQLSDSFTQVGITTTSTATISDLFKGNFQGAQWVQLRIEMSSNAVTPTFNRLTEIRVRNYPSQPHSK